MSVSPKAKYILIAALIGPAVFAALAFAYVAITSSVGVSHPHAPPAILVGLIAAVYSAPVGLLFALILSAVTTKNYRRLIMYLAISFVIFAATVTIAVRPK